MPVTVKRGYMDSNAEAHVAGDEVLVCEMFVAGERERTPSPVPWGNATERVVRKYPCVYIDKKETP